MSLDLGAEVNREKFLNWVENNKNQIIEDLISEEEEILFNMWEFAIYEELKVKFENKENKELEKEVNNCNEGVGPNE